LKYNNGEIIVSPKIIFWIDIPPVIGEHERIELLKHDILVIGFDGNINKLLDLERTKNKYTAYFFNLDKMISTNNIKTDDIKTFALNLATFIGNFVPDKCLLHTNLINQEFAAIFREQGVSYVEKNLGDINTVFKTMTSMVQTFFSEQLRMQRASIRLHLLPLQYKLEINNAENSTMPIVYGYIKDLSLNGMGFVLKIQNDLNFFKLKDKVQIRLFIQQSILKINLALVTRIDPANQEIGVTFNISDPHMIREDYGNRLTSLIYNWLKGIIEKYGKIESEQQE